MSQKKQNDTDFITEFINIYKEHTALWKVKSPEYSNRQLKDKGYRELINLYRKYNIENANKDSVKKKISSLRSSFRRELKKVKKEKSGMGGEEAEENEPSLWYFNLLLFTIEHEDTRDGISNDQSEEDEMLIEDNSENRPPKRKCKSVENDKDKKKYILQKAYEVLANEDEYDAYAVTVAAKLRKLSEEQRLYCENIINTALYKAALNQLTEHTILTSASTQVPRPMRNFNINSILNSSKSSVENSFVPLSTVQPSTSSNTFSTYNYSEYDPLQPNDNNAQQYYQSFNPNE